jgi:aminoglycoside phosphotransferase (APT) family kinase protein
MKVDGRNFKTPYMADLTPEARGQIIGETNRVLAAIHDVDLVATGLTDYGPEGNYYLPASGPLEQTIPRLGNRAYCGNGCAD